MTLTHIAVFGAAALLYGAVISQQRRGWLLLIASVVAIYWLQPFTSIRQLDFILPTATLALAITCWLFIRTPARPTRDDTLTLTIVAVLVLLVSATRYLIPELRLTSRPPDVSIVFIALLLTAGIIAAVWRLLRRWHYAQTALILLITVIFVFLKSEPLATWMSATLREWQGQDVTLATPLDLSWLGFSYVAFRLTHTLRDRQTGQLPALTLREYLTYVIFFPAYTAGPIDRAERFVIDYRALPRLDTPRLLEGTGRIIIGLLKKFVAADTLALIALDADRAAQATSTGGLWLLVYAYAFRLFFDFSGYSDIAIGIGILYGIRLPENFDRPYLKNNIAAFWQSWHITLSGWVRFYVFSPLSRWLLSRENRPSIALILLVSHLTTMILIGLWHGITWTFFVWGLWHGIGLFAHKLWSDRTRKWYIRLKQRPHLQHAWTIFGVLLTFHYVLLGWVWFALPDFDTALTTLHRLFGL
jgi:D-alanyl-lipoteichoic acid acyltransferase DltB (MBOAT superfamily)